MASQSDTTDPPLNQAADPRQSLPGVPSVSDSHFLAQINTNDHTRNIGLLKRIAVYFILTKFATLTVNWVGFAADAGFADNAVAEYAFYGNPCNRPGVTAAAVNSMAFEELVVMYHYARNATRGRHVSGIRPDVTDWEEFQYHFGYASICSARDTFNEMCNKTYGVFVRR